jgi:general secretion pathway protein H
VSRRNLSKADGYTLVEMLTVLGLLALIATLTFPANSGGKSRSDMDSHAKTIVNMLRTARLAAISENIETSFDVDILNRSIVAAGFGERVQLGNDISLSMLTARREVQPAGGSIRFFPDGTSTGGSLELKKGRRAISVEIQWLTGRISREDSK